jgi:hypothetical protein
MHLLLFLNLISIPLIKRHVCSNVHPIPILWHRAILGLNINLVSIQYHFQLI